jgi:rhodanese-related sulfurtransferase
VALTLKRRGIRAVRPLAGGFEWWQHRNYPLAAAAIATAGR